MNLIKVKDVAERLNVSVATVYKLAEKKLLKCVKIGACLRFTEEQVSEYLRKCILEEA